MNAHVSVQKYYGDTIEDFEAIEKLLESLPGIVAAAPIIDAKVGIAAKSNLERFDGVVLWGIEPDSFSEVSDLPAHRSRMSRMTLSCWTPRTVRSIRA